METKLPSEIYFPCRGYSPIEFMHDLDQEKANEIREAVKNFNRKCSRNRKREVTGNDRNFIDNYVGEFDVVDFLLGSSGREHLVTNQGGEVPVHDLWRKHVIIACFSAPLLSGSYEAMPCLGLIHLWDHLCAKKVKDCKVVVVIKERSEFADPESEFEHLFAAFPQDFLAIPFSDYESRERVCNFFSKFTQPAFAGAIVDPYGYFLDKSLLHLVDCAAAYYPFSKDRYYEVRSKDDELQARLDSFSYSPPWRKDDHLNVGKLPRLTLAELLTCDPEDHVLLKIKGLDEVQPASVSVLDGKIVGLYLCQDGNIMKPLKQLQEQCSYRGSKFEVVVVPLALSDNFSSCLHHIKLALAHLNITSWWVLSPYNDIVTRTLRRITGRTVCDKLIILPGDSYSGEIQGEKVLACVQDTKSRGLDLRNYPFTRQMLYWERFYTLSEVTPLTLFNRFKYVYHCKGGSPIPLEEAFKDKCVLVYFNSYDSPRFEDDVRVVLKMYPKFKNKYGDCEVVCVFSRGKPKPSASKRGGRLGKLSKEKSLVKPGDDFVKGLPWVMIDSPGEAAVSLPKQLFATHLGEKNKSKSLLVAFGKDRGIVSRSVINDVPVAVEVYNGVAEDVNDQFPA